MTRITQLSSTICAGLLLLNQIVHLGQWDENQTTSPVKAAKAADLTPEVEKNSELDIDKSNAKDRANDVGSAEASPGQLSPEAAQRRDKIRRCLWIYFSKYVDADRLSPWSLMHALIAYGSDSQIVAKGKPTNALAYLCANGVGRDQQLFTLHRRQLQPRKGPNVQGHDGQFLAMLAQSNVPSDYPIKVDGRSFTVQDLIEFEKRGCRTGQELTFRLIGLANYLPSDAAWKNDQGQYWSIPHLIKEELKQPVIGASCGGTHRLMGLSYAVEVRRARGERIHDQWLRAAKYVEDYHDYAIKLQNPDGSFSTNFFDGPGTDPDLTKRLYTTGHVLEWLVFSLPEDRLTDPQVTKAVDYLVDLMLQAPNHSLSVGPRGHALRALKLYQQRVFGETIAYRQAMKNLPEYVPAQDDSPAKKQKTQLLRVFGRRR